MLIHFDLGSLILTLLIGLAAGFVANYLFGKQNSSLLTNLLLGLGGAIIGGFLLPLFGIFTWGIIGNFFSATVGALLLLFIVRIFSKRTNY